MTPELEDQDKLAFTWTTDDEVEFINHLFEEGRRTGEWQALNRYPVTIFRRRWDPEVDVDVVFLSAQRAISRAKLYQEAHQ